MLEGEVDVQSGLHFLVASADFRPDYTSSDTHWVSRVTIGPVGVRNAFAFSAMEVDLPLSDAICQMYAGAVGHIVLLTSRDWDRTQAIRLSRCLLTDTSTQNE